MKWVFVLAVLLVSTACAVKSESWHWEHPDPKYAGQYLWRDINKCEDLASRLEDRGPFEVSGNARDYGGWGDFRFELCMESRGWEMAYGTIGNSTR